MENKHLIIIAFSIIFSIALICSTIIIGSYCYNYFSKVLFVTHNYVPKFVCESGSINWVKDNADKAYYRRGI